MANVPLSEINLEMERLSRELGSEPVLVGKGNIHSPGKSQIFGARRNGSDLHYN
jgi:hypothetical protein